jgi:hypothetical protein
MRCAVKHYLDGSGKSVEAADDGGRAEATSGGWKTVGSAPGKKVNKGGRGRKKSIRNNGIAAEEQDIALSADEFCIIVVAHYSI